MVDARTRDQKQNYTMSPSNMVLPSRSVREVEVQESAPSNGHAPQDEGGLGPVACSNLSYLESEYQKYLESPDSISPEWRDYFRQIAETQAKYGSEVDLFKAPRMGNGSVASPVELDYAILQERVDRLIRNY